MNDCNDDFQDFLSSKESSPSVTLSKKISSYVKKDLDPSHKTIFLKLILVQAFMGGITLIFCPQFNFSLTNNYELFHFFHRQFGMYICSAICGGIFIGSGAIFASYILKTSEVR
ncbi:hypothetical protein OAB57_03155, partial [Bacteriovoracaceae bacterium]|nr:hypothetical protein [Bacteriovoracaceae bacterium]